jgi:DNA-directed RNA polymerase subunit RPC12/RpoP
MKTCTRCNKEYAATSEYFYLDKRVNRLRADCKKCTYDRSNQWRKNNPEKRNAYNRKYDNRKARESYGFTEGLFEAMKEYQENKCAICGTDNPIKLGKNKDWAADHDHKTGKPRGLLCHHCNLTIGNMEKKGIDWIIKAKQYIEQGGFYDKGL